MARELQGHFQVTVLEAGREFRPFARDLVLLERLKKTGLFFDERQVQLLFPSMRVRKTVDNIMALAKRISAVCARGAW